MEKVFISVMNTFAIVYKMLFEMKLNEQAIRNVGVEKKRQLKMTNCFDADSQYTGVSV